jgi:predicted nucleic acid-binding protein
MSSFSVILDACVIVPAPLRDTLLRAAAKGLFRVHWSDDILEEVERTLVNRRLTDAPKARYLIETLEETFEEAKVLEGYRELIPGMRVNPKDRHVVAAAVVAGAQTIVTANVRDFPDVALAGFGIEAQTPDEFLLHQLSLQPDILANIIREQAAATRNPPLTVGEVLGNLQGHAPTFVRHVTKLLEDGNRDASKLENNVASVSCRWSD